nr:MAG TPA: hypothetical protein [Caudoviricetes sp.]
MDRIAHANTHLAFTHPEFLEDVHERQLATIGVEQGKELVQNLHLRGAGGRSALGGTQGHDDADRFQNGIGDDHVGMLTGKDFSEERLRLLALFLVLLQGFHGLSRDGAGGGFSGSFNRGSLFNGEVFNDGLSHGGLLSGFNGSGFVAFDSASTTTRGSCVGAHVRLLLVTTGRPYTPAQYCTSTRVSFLSTVAEPSLPAVENTLPHLPEKGKPFFGIFEKIFFRSREKRVTQDTSRIRFNDVCAVGSKQVLPARNSSQVPSKQRTFQVKLWGVKIISHVKMGGVKIVLGSFGHI